MKLGRVHIKNFRRFSSLEIPFHPRCNVIVGANGSGKTTVLDSIALCLEGYAQIVSKRSCNHLVTKKDIKNIKNLEDVIFPTLLAEDAETKTKWTASVHQNNQDQSKIYSQNISFHYNNNTSTSNGTASNDEITTIAYYRAHRRVQKSVQSRQVVKESISEAFANWADATTSYSKIIQWFFDEDSKEAREQRKNKSFKSHTLEAVKNAVIQAIPLAQGLSVEGTYEQPYLVIHYKDKSLQKGEQLLNQLSAGYQSMISLIMDFAFRLALANPKSKTPLECHGILLIDEIDLHLHPTWQQRVIPDLLKSFPNTQIIATTHSPAVLTTIKSENILILDAEKEMIMTAPPATDGATVQRLLNRVMQTEERPPENENSKKIVQLFDLIEANPPKLEEAKELLEELKKWGGIDEPELVRAEMFIGNIEALKDL